MINGKLVGGPLILGLRVATGVAGPNRRQFGTFYHFLHSAGRTQFFCARLIVISQPVNQPAGQSLLTWSLLALCCNFCNWGTSSKEPDFGVPLSYLGRTILD